MRSLLPSAVVLSAALLCAAPATATDWVQAPGSSLVFAGTYQGDTFSGHFPGFQTRLRFDPAELETARLEVDIPLAGVTTGNPDYDGEMRGAAFFDVGRHATARYTATEFRALEDGAYAADGVLELRGTSHPVTLTFSWHAGDQPVLSGRATVDRLAFGVGAGMWSDTSVLPAGIAVSTRVVFRRERSDGP